MSPEDRKSVVARVAKHFVDRAKAQQLKGKARDRAAIEFVCGAAATAAVIHGDKSDEWSALSMLAFFVSLEGFKHLEQRAAEVPA